MDGRFVSYLDCVPLSYELPAKLIDLKRLPASVAMGSLKILFSYLQLLRTCVFMLFLSIKKEDSY